MVTSGGEREQHRARSHDSNNFNFTLSEDKN